jgi:hypothetical protein
LSLSVIVKHSVRTPQSTRSDCVGVGTHFTVGGVLSSPLQVVAVASPQLGRSSPRAPCRRRSLHLHPAQRSCARLRSPSGRRGSKLCQVRSAPADAASRASTRKRRPADSQRRPADAQRRPVDGMWTSCGSSATARERRSPRPVRSLRVHRRPCVHCIGARAFTAACTALRADA